MIDTLQALLQSGAIAQSVFGPQSRYVAVATKTYTSPDGRTIQYVGRRFIPQRELFAVLQVHRVAQGERVDTMATQFLGDPLLYWRICDANLAVRPDDLEQSGKVLNITLPAGIPGVTQ